MLLALPPDLPIVAQLAPDNTLEREAPILIRQATDRVLASTERLAYVLGKCSRMMPTGSSLPSVAAAGEPIDEINLQELNDGLAGVSAIGYAEGLAQADDRSLTVRGCAADINDAAADLEAHAQGYRDLITALGALS